MAARQAHDYVRFPCHLDVLLYDMRGELLAVGQEADA
jgi:hypothetical protein